MPWAGRVARGLEGRRSLPPLAGARVRQPERPVYCYAQVRNQPERQHLRRHGGEEPQSSQGPRRQRVRHEELRQELDRSPALGTSHGHASAADVRLCRDRRALGRDVHCTVVSVALLSHRPRRTEPPSQARRVPLARTGEGTDARAVGGLDDALPLVRDLQAVPLPVEREQGPRPRRGPGGQAPPRGLQGLLPCAALRPCPREAVRLQAVSGQGQDAVGTALRDAPGELCVRECGAFGASLPPIPNRCEGLL
mmetsp:Transcript_40604/g.126661  ORF Transcript_40604/g.126661 Transcript_40604/m.126661 type:complete len:252 (+) Transcript_40604:8-763(+)